MEILIRVYTSFLWCCPARRIHSCRYLLRLAFLLPPNEQGDGVFCSLNATKRFSRASGPTGCDLHRPVSWHHRLANVDMMGVEVVRDITILTRPCLEGLQLELWLRHIRVKVVEISEFPGFGLRVRIRRIETLMMLNEYEDTVDTGLSEEVLVMGEKFGGRLCDQYMDATPYGVQCNRIVSGVRGKYRDSVTRREGVNCR